VTLGAFVADVTKRIVGRGKAGGTEAVLLTRASTRFAVVFRASHRVAVEAWRAMLAKIAGCVVLALLIEFK